ncbi:oxygenase MpaB family protein [Nocardia sp. CDC160]|nr:oxygenase MpaB family protein [Nocardia sp. CDC160]MEC3916811.1 oxygenase MpaB family protein [Nocardia sp. CDC160]
MVDPVGNGSRSRFPVSRENPHAALIEDVRWFGGSLLWPFFGQLALDQVAYREIAAAVDRSGQFAANFTDRGLRSFAFTALYLFADPTDAAAFTAKLKSMHGAVRGRGTGEFADTRYSALNPELWKWVAASGLNLMYKGYLQIAGRDLDATERDIVYQTLRSVLSTLELPSSATTLPATAAELTAYYDEVAATKLADNGFLQQARQHFDHLPVPMLLFPRVIHPAVRPLWRAAIPVFARPAKVCSDANQHPRMRELLGIRWTRANQVEYALYRAVLHLAWRYLPRRLTLDPLAYNRFRYEKIRDTYASAQLDSFAAAS